MLFDARETRGAGDGDAVRANATLAAAVADRLGDDRLDLAALAAGDGVDGAAQQRGGLVDPAILEVFADLPTALRGSAARTGALGVQHLVAEDRAYVGRSVARRFWGNGGACPLQVSKPPFGVDA